jgi:hypothetical protein
MTSSKPFYTKQYIVPVCMICGKPTETIKTHTLRRRIGRSGVKRYTEEVTTINVPAHTSCWLPRKLGYGVGGLGSLLIPFSCYMLIGGLNFIEALPIIIPAIAFGYLFYRAMQSLDNAADKAKRASYLLSFLQELKNNPAQSLISGNTMSSNFMRGTLVNTQKEYVEFEAITKARDELIKKYGEVGRKLVDHIAAQATQLWFSQRGVQYLLSGLPIRDEHS